jgi:hypothetical protein
MTELNPFDAVPDPELGRLLRQHFDPTGADDFVARVRAALPGGRPASTLDVLQRWIRPGLAAAAVIALAAALWLVRSTGPQAVGLEDDLLPGGDVVLAFAIDGS